MSLEEAVTTALSRVGHHRFVPFTVERAEHDGGEVRVGLTLRFQQATPICCGEPGCYTRFLGARRRDVPAALASVLELTAPPRVSMTVRTVHEPGYAHTTPGESAQDSTLEYPPEHFASQEG
jgi:hypothetical protein